MRVLRRRGWTALETGYVPGSGAARSSGNGHGANGRARNGFAGNGDGNGSVRTGRGVGGRAANGHGANGRGGNGRGGNGHARAARVVLTRSDLDRQTEGTLEGFLRAAPSNGHGRNGHGTAHRASRPAATPVRRRRRFTWLTDRPVGALVRFVLALVVGSLFVSVLVSPLAAIPRALNGTFQRLSDQAPLPPPRILPQTTFLFDRKGRVLATLHAEVNRTEIPLEDMPIQLRNAVIATEDKDYYREGGVSLPGIARALFENVKAGKLVQGGSTITQQYVKNVYTGNAPTLHRKVREALLAEKLSKLYTKDQILEKYLNTVYFGHGAYGVEAAALTYFGKHARELGVLQAATLAGLIAAPARWDALSHPKAAHTRRNQVLDRMAAEGYLTADQVAVMKTRKLGTKRPVVVSQAPYFTDAVRKDLQNRFGEERTFGGGLRVRTTLDLDWQRAAEQAVATHLPTPGDPSAAVVAIDPTSGAIRAMVGGTNFRKKKFNLATQAHRQTGSSFKVYTLATAMQQLIDPHALWNGPPELPIPDKRCYTEKDGVLEPWTVHNYADEGAGTMDLFSATAHSVNTIFAQVALEVGPENIVETAHKMGIRSKLQPVCSLTLGTEAVTPLEMTSAYSTLAARGIHHPPTFEQQVKDPRGKTLQTIDRKGTRALDQNVADMTAYIMQNVICCGTGTAANFGRPAAGKTGTAQFYVDAWFCGFVPQLVTCVWVGYPQGEIPMYGVEGYNGIFGGSIPAAIWHDFMAYATKDMPAVGFVTPDFSHNTFKPERTVELPPPPPPSSDPAPDTSGHHRKKKRHH